MAERTSRSSNCSTRGRKTFRRRGAPSRRRRQEERVRRPRVRARERSQVGRDMVLLQGRRSGSSIAPLGVPPAALPPKAQGLSAVLAGGSGGGPRPIAALAFHSFPRRQPPRGISPAPIFLRKTAPDTPPTRPRPAAKETSSLGKLPIDWTNPNETIARARDDLRRQPNSAIAH